LSGGQEGILSELLHAGLCDNTITQMLSSGGEGHLITAQHSLSDVLHLHWTWLMYVL